MKKIYLNTLWGRLGIALLFLITAIVIHSCRKESKTDLLYTDLATRPERTNTVSPDDISNWFSVYPQLKPAGVLLDAAQQAVINGQQVIRIPVATNAALYFTKENGVLNVYAYKWVYNQPSTVKYTGTIDIYNFQSQQLISNVYENDKIVKYALLADNKAIVSTGSNRLKINTFDLLGRIWCFITSGTYISQEDIDAGRSAGANGDVGRVGCDYSALNGGVDAGDYFPSLVYYFIPDSSDQLIINTGSGSSGGGPKWGPPPCPPNSPGNNLSVKLKVNKEAPGDGSGCGISSGDPGEWTPYVVDPYYFDIDAPYTPDPANYYKLDDQTRLNYPRFTKLVDQLPAYLKANPSVVAALIYYTGYTQDQIMQMVAPGQGPQIVVQEMTGDIGYYTRDDRYGSPIVPTPNIFYISASFVRGLESANYTSTQQATAFLLAVTIFHESVHLGRAMNRLPDSDTTNYDYGWGFEQMAYKVIVNVDNATSVINYTFKLN